MLASTCICTIVPKYVHRGLEEIIVSHKAGEPSRSDADFFIHFWCKTKSNGYFPVICEFQYNFFINM